MMIERIQVGRGIGATRAERSTVMGLRVNVNILEFDMESLRLRAG